MKYPILYSFKRCPYAMRARMALQLAGIKCELREVRLNNKPDHMLEASPKGTVPVLVLGDKVIDESNDIINWVLNDHKIFEVNLSDEQSNLAKDLIELFDEKFKFHLDIQVGESSIDYTALAKKEHLSDVEIRVRKLADRITSITNEMHYQRSREEEFRNTSESTNGRVMWWSIFQTTVMLLSTLWQIKHLKTFFEEKKLV